MKNQPPVWLMRRKIKLKSGRSVVHWMLRWPGTGLTAKGNVKYVTESLGRCTRAEAEDARRKKIADLSTGAAAIDRPDKIRLAQLKTLYLERRTRDKGSSYTSGRWHKRYPKIGKATLDLHRMTLRYLIQHFGANCLIETITPMQATEFFDALAVGKLEGARKKSKRTYTLGEQTIRGRIRDCKTIFGWAATFGLITASPFGGFCGTPLPTDPKHYVTMDDFEKLLGAAPTPGWRAMFGLCRLAGLRRGEAQGLPWSGEAKDKQGRTRRIGVDLFKHRLYIVAVKTHMYRVIPIVPQLLEILADVYHPDQATVTGLPPNNLNRNGRSMAFERAGLTPWADFFHAMRKSAEDDWKTRGVAEATYAAWLGHSTKVSRENYVSPTEAEFDAVTKAA